MIVVLSRHGARGEGRGHAIAAMACSAGHGLLCRCGIRIFHLRQVFRINLIGHGDHDSRDGLVRISVGGVVGLVSCRVTGVAELALDSEGSCIAAHEGEQVGNGDVPGKHLQVGWLGHGPARMGLGWRLLGCGSAVLCGGCECGGRGDKKIERLRRERRQSCAARVDPQNFGIFRTGTCRPLLHRTRNSGLSTSLSRAIRDYGRGCLG